MASPDRAALPEWAQEIVHEVTPKRTDEERAAVREVLGGLYTDLPFTINALKVVVRRYLARDETGKVTETPEEMFFRVACALAAVEYDYGADDATVEKHTRDFFGVMARFQFTPAGRTLTNAGTNMKVVANCVVLHIEDDMHSIFQTLHDAAMLQKAGCGIGFPLHLMRPAGARTVTSQSESSGPISFLYVYNAAFGVIKQQNRHGANMAVMSVEHPDILEFIQCKWVEGAIKNFNISVGITDRFMRQATSDDPSVYNAPWKCTFNGVEYDPREIKRDANYMVTSITPTPMSARELFLRIVDCAWRNGEPGVVFLDTANAVNPVPGLGRLETTNPCGEQFLHDGDVCNLGSINLEKFVAHENVASLSDGIDFVELKRVSKIVTRMLDNVIDLSEYPIERVNATRLANRRIGLGVMGFADMLMKLREGYGTRRGRAIGRLVMHTINVASHEMSSELAAEKGAFPNWSASIYGEAMVPRRNSAVTTVAPTGSIAMIFDVSGGLEPYFALSYHYEAVLGGNVELRYLNKHLVAALEEEGLNTPEIMAKVIKYGTLKDIPEIPPRLREVFVTSMDITADQHIEMQAAFQKETDNSISKTINFRNDATHEDCAQGYLKAWKSGCKGCTLYRDGSRFLQVLNLNTDENASAPEAPLTGSGKACPTCDASLVRSEGCLSCLGCGYSACERE